MTPNINQVRDQVRDQVKVQIYKQVRDQVRDQVRNQVGGQVCIQVERQVWGRFRNQIIDNEQVQNRVWSQAISHFKREVVI